MAASLNLDEHVRRIVALHFDPTAGSPYWLERQRELGLDAIDAIQGSNDLIKLGPMREQDLAERPVTDFVPLACRDRLVGAIVTETGGATGLPKRTIFAKEEFAEAFVTPFVRAAKHADFPHGELWLWVGPSGPHVIGQAAAACATALGSPQPFSVDFDPRWFRKMPADSLGRARYLEHLLEQAMHVIDHESIGVLFTTPVVLSQLAERMSDAQRDRIHGVHYGGMRIEPQLLLDAQTKWFSSAAHLAGYGNSLFGVCMEFGGKPDRPLRYHPYGARHLVRVAEDGRIWMSRLDETVLIANLPERDAGAPVHAPADAPPGFGPGVEDPHPITTAASSATGIY